MITVTIEGRVGEGKTRIGQAIANHARQIGKTVMWREDVTDEALTKYKPDVLIVTKVRSNVAD